MSFYTRTLYVLGALIVGRTDCSVCDTDNGGCSQNCVPIGSEENLCTCRNGYQLNSTNHKSCFGKPARRRERWRKELRHNLSIVGGLSR